MPDEPLSMEEQCDIIVKGLNDPVHELMETNVDPHAVCVALALTIRGVIKTYIPDEHGQLNALLHAAQTLVKIPLRETRH